MEFLSMGVLDYTAVDDNGFIPSRGQDDMTAPVKQEKMFLPNATSYCVALARATLHCTVGKSRHDVDLQY
ncbi:hypothetical protein [Actimicrobium antarcticum]|uniref:Uncharacterized protein n=1 Tax=Actimicrobium antarcticum TaxID=1051899 RepID=A0ABP7SHI5_9BURK